MSRLQSRIEHEWQQPGVLSASLYPLSLLYGGVVAVRRLMYRYGLRNSYRAPVPVVIIGNLTVGGTGKTPLIIHLLDALQAKGIKAAVISRGYGGSATRYPLIVDANTDAAECGDESALIFQKTGAPVAVGPDRRASVEALLNAFDVELILSDDGLQHLALERDLEVCVVDGARGNLNQRQLPAGPFRESPRRLRSVDFVVCNGGGCQHFDFDMRISAGSPYPIGSSDAVFLADDGVHAVAGIGNPERFFSTCEQQGWDIERHPFPDHHQFTISDFDFADGRPILMTEKDAVKCTDIADRNLWALPVDVTIEPDLITHILQRLPAREAHD